MSHPASATVDGAARTLTNWLDPKTWIISVSLIVGWTAHTWTGLAWGAVSAIFAAVIPIIVIKRGVALGSWADRHLGVRRHRLTAMIIILASVATGTALMLTLAAPREIIALTAAMFATLAALAAITTRWKISVHTAVAAGTATMLAFCLPPALTIVFAALAAAVGWSRIHLRGHTPAQAVAGGAIGIMIAGILFASLS